MFDTAARGSVPPASPVVPIFQFLTIEVMKTGDGLLNVSLAATSLDETNLEFINDDTESVRVPSIDEALSVIRRGISDALSLRTSTEVQ